MLPLLKKLPGYQEGRFIYLAAFKRRQLWSYLRHRFYYGPKIKRLDIGTWALRDTDLYSFHTLCGHQHVVMLVWSLASWLYQTKELPALYLHSDGTLTPDDIALLRRVFPRVTVVEPEAVKNDISARLAAYPHLRAYRENYQKHQIYLPKLIDPYFLSPASYKLFFDVDILFFNYPQEIMECLRSATPFMTAGNLDMFTTNGLAGFRFADGSLPEKTSGFLNGGIVGYPQTSFDLAALDHYFERCGPDNNYRLIEQAGYAYLLSRCQNFHTLDIKNYHIKGPVSQLTVSKHYTGPRREEFWLEGIKILRSKILSYGK